MQRIGDFELDRRLGSGAFATVWLARDPQLDANVAIKVLGDNWVGQPDIVRRFIDEARLLRQAEDQRVVDVYTLGELDTGQPWFAMAHADRGTLEDRLSSDPLPLDQALGLIAEMGRCVEAVHRLDAVHRDVKPGNFLIRSTRPELIDQIPGLAPDERLLIGDLGLAKVLANSSGFTVAAGSPLYMAPEQATMSADVTFAADVFSLAICAWEVLTGQLPPRTGGLAGAGQFESDALPAVSTLRPDVPAHVDAAIAKATKRDPAERWQSVGEFLMALAPPAAAIAPVDVETTEASRQTKPLLVGAAVAAIAAAVVAFLVISSGGADRIAGTPDWFETPSEATNLTVSADGDVTSIIAVLPAGFVTTCEAFLVDAVAADWQILRDDCATDEAFASVQDGAETGVFARLSDGRAGWQFEGS